MLPAISSAVSGMRLATLRLEGSARNIANLNSRGTLPLGGANAPPVYLLVRADQVVSAAPASVPGGPVLPVRNVSPTWMATYDQDFASAGGPDLAGEMLELISAEHSFVANAKALETAQAMVKRLYELTD
jgi:flagellar basal-body rod protein FlgC